MPTLPRCLRCYRSVESDHPQEICPSCQGTHHLECWNTQGGCGACAPHQGPQEAPSVLEAPVGRDPTLKLTPRAPVAQVSKITHTDDETVDIRQKRSLEPPPVDPDDTLHLQPDRDQPDQPELAVANEDLETAFLKRGDRSKTENEETAVLKRAPQEEPPAAVTRQSDTTRAARPSRSSSGSDAGRAAANDATIAAGSGSDSSGSDVGRAAANDATIAAGSGSDSSGSDVGRAAANDATVAAGTAPAVPPPAASDATVAAETAPASPSAAEPSAPVTEPGWWEEESTEPAAGAGRRGSAPRPKRASGRISERISARHRTTSTGRRGRLLFGTLGLLGILLLLGALVGPDLFAPKIQILQPTGSQVSGGAFLLRGEVEDTSKVEVTVDGLPVSLFGVGGGRTFEALLERPLGPATVLIEARDDAGNVSREELALECLAPHVTLSLTAPSDGSTLSGPTVRVSGVVETDALTTAFKVHAQGVEARVDASGKFQLDVPLEDGRQTLEIVAKGAGGEARARVTVVGDRTPPRLTLLRPTDRHTSASQLRVTCRVEDASPWVEVVLRGTHHRVERGALFSATVELKPGESMIRCQVVDAAGLVGTPLELVVARSLPLEPEDFKQAWAQQPQSYERYRLIKQLDPLLGEDAEKSTSTVSLTLLEDFVLKTQGWYGRQAAIETLADHADRAFGEALARRIQSPDFDPVIAEGIVRALGRAGRVERVPDLLAQLSAQKWILRRAAADALGDLPDPRAISPLIAALEREQHHRVRLALRRALARIARRDEPDSGWQAWWSANQASFSLWAAPESARADPTTISAQGVNLIAAIRGTGPVVLVLPEFGLESTYLQEALEPLEQDFRLVYLTLPGRGDFQEPPLGDPNDLDTVVPFPLARFSDALAASQELGTEPLGFVAHGISGWLALDFARRHPQRVRRLMLVGTPPGREVWAAARGRLLSYAEEIGDRELHRLAQAWLDVGAPPAAPFNEEGQALVRAAWTLQFADPRDLSIGRLLGALVEKSVGGRVRLVRAGERPLVGMGLPDYRLADLASQPAIATVLLRGEHTVPYAAADYEGMVKRLGSETTRLLTFKRSAQAPMIEENDRFLELAAKFFAE